MTGTLPGRALGTPLGRIEGPAKVTGAARYAAEYPVANAAHAWIVQSPVARGVLRSVEADPLAEGVLAVLWHGNAPQLHEGDDPELFVLQSERISYRGQVVALVVAETLETARRAAQSVVLDIAEEPHDVVLRADHPDLYVPDTGEDFPAETTHGDAEAALAAAPVTVDVTYTTPPQHNSPMEPHATIAVWDGDDLTLYDSNQGPWQVASGVASVLGVDQARVRVVAEHVGGGFGSKGSARPNAVLAAIAARLIGRPVKLSLPRQALFSMVGHRSPTIQRVRLGADSGGTLTAITHDSISQSSRLFEFVEQSAVVTRLMYAAANRRTGHRMLRLDLPTPRWMRAPGEAPGMVALECAMDELAVKLGIDPIELRVRNEPDVEPESGTPFTSRNYVACLRQGAERFGWADRDPRPAQRRDGEWWVGTGMAGATYPAMAQPSTARARRLPDGRVEVLVAATDIGTGARTVLTQIAADALGLPVDAVTVRIGDTELPKAPVAGGSSGTASWGWAVDGACHKLRSSGAEEAFFDTTELLKDRGMEGRHAYGAHFAEVRVSAVTGEVRVPRLFGMYAAGRILNPRTARSQFIGGMTMGLGMALHEGAVLDPHTGVWVNHDLADYHIPAHADVPSIEAAWIDEEDGDLNPMGSKGVGEIGIVGSPAAILNAVWHATGVRVRDLPARLDRILPNLP